MKKLLIYLNKIDFKFICYWLFASFFMGIVMFFAKKYHISNLHLMSFIFCVSFAVNLFKSSFEYLINKK